MKKKEARGLPLTQSKALASAVTFLVAGLILGTTTGCPDYSQLRPVPDYENMTDGGEVTPEDESSD